MDSNFCDSEVLFIDSDDNLLALISEDLKDLGQPDRESIEAKRAMADLRAKVGTSTESRKTKVDTGITHAPIKIQKELPNNESFAKSSSSSATDPEPNIECLICNEIFLLGNGIRCQKQKIKEDLGVDFHAFCRDCVKKYVEANVDEMQLAETKDGFKCMAENCNRPICYASFCTLLSEATRRRFEERMQQENLAQIASLERCKNCLFAVEIEGHPEVVQFFACPICDLYFCRLCKRDADPVHFGKTCEEIDRQEAEAIERAERERPRVQQVQYHDEMAEIIIRRCKNCSTPIIKSTGCNKLICKCGTTMCYWCRASNINYDHFRQGPCNNKLHDEGYQERDNQAVEAIRQRMNDLEF